MSSHNSKYYARKITKKEASTSKSITSFFKKQFLVSNPVPEPENTPSDVTPTSKKRNLESEFEASGDTNEPSTSTKRLKLASPPLSSPPLASGELCSLGPGQEDVSSDESGYEVVPTPDSRLFSSTKKNAVVELEIINKIFCWWLETGKALLTDACVLSIEIKSVNYLYFDYFSTLKDIKTEKKWW